MREIHLVSKYGTVQVSECCGPPQFVLMTEVSLISDLARIQLVVTIGVQSSLHQVASEFAV